MGTLHEDVSKFMVSSWILIRMRFFQKKVVENLKTHILCPVDVFWTCSIYEIVWINMVEQDTQMTVNTAQKRCDLLARKLRQENGPNL